MGEDLKTLMAKLKAQQISKSPSSKSPETPKTEKVEENEEMDLGIDEEIKETAETTKTELKNIQAKQEPSKDIDKEIDPRLIEMELLQNNGRFRAELLYQLQEINKGILFLAEVLMNNGQKN